jgi:pimeloyl-ACP methyl ester carboxylesterase
VTHSERVDVRVADTLQTDVTEKSATYLDELANLVMLHARAQGLSPRKCARLLARIGEPSGDGPTSWATVWSESAERRAVAGRDLDAARFYNLARFPYIDGPARAAAYHNCMDSFARWAMSCGCRRRAVTTGSGEIAAWVSTPPGGRERPALLVVCGGIVSVKEQWGNLLGLAGRLGMAVAVTEMPGVGENTVAYDADAWRFFPALLDELADVADSGQAYLLALSFSGHLALRASLHDPRIRGIATVGAPVRALFRDPAAFARLPETTVRTLSHLTGTPRADLPALLAPWALGDELADVAVPVHYVASRRDEIIPADDPALLARLAPGAHVVEHDDVHGSPNHLLATRLWIARSLLDMRGLGTSPPARVLGLLQGAARAGAAAKAVAGAAGGGSRRTPASRRPTAAATTNSTAGVAVGDAGAVTSTEAREQAPGPPPAAEAQPVPTSRRAGR